MANQGHNQRVGTHQSQVSGVTTEQNKAMEPYRATEPSENVLEFYSLVGGIYNFIMGAFIKKGRLFADRGKTNLKARYVVFTILDPKFMPKLVDSTEITF
jgi:hypothetical protein